MCVITNARADPTHTAGLRRRAMAEIRKRLRGLYADLRPQIYDSVVSVDVEKESVVVNRNIYRYELLDTIDMDEEINRLIEKWFGTNGNRPPDRWFFGQEVEAAYARGSEAAAAKIQSIAGSELGATGVETLLRSRPYFDRIARVRLRAFEEMKGLTGDMRNNLRRILSDGVSRGVGPQSIARDIRKQLNTSQSRANTIARTEIGTSFRDSRRDLAVDSRDRLGLDVRLQWVSALAPTTRPEHAERHLNYYTPEEVADFYARDGNAINCLCSQNEVIITASGDILGERKWTKRDQEEVDRILAA